MLFALTHFHTARQRHALQHRHHDRA
jgi:hypothetical protein